MELIPILLVVYFYLKLFFPSDGFYEGKFEEITKIELPKNTKILYKESSFLGETIPTPFYNSTLNELQKEKLHLEIKELQEKTKNNIETIQFDNVIKKKKSNFYENLEKYQKVSYRISNDKKEISTNNVFIKRVKFKNYIITSNNLKPIHFNMESNEFKTLVQTGNIEFKNGSSINCYLIIHKKNNI